MIGPIAFDIFEVKSKNFITIIKPEFVNFTNFSKFSYLIAIVHFLLIMSYNI